MAFEAPAPREPAGRTEDRDVVAAGVAEAALLFAQHAFDEAHAVEQFQALLVQHRGEQRPGRLGLGRLHLAQGETRAAARNVMPVEPVVELEGDQRLPALAVVEKSEEAVGLLGDALGGVDGLRAGAPERQEGCGGEDEPPRRSAMVVTMTMAVIVMIVRMPAVVRHGAAIRSKCAGISASSRRAGSTSR